MRVLCEMPPARHRTVAEGWRSVFLKMGHEFTLWHPAAKPVFDVFDEVRPEIYIKTEAEYVPGEAKCLGEYGGRIKTVDRREIDPGFDSLKFKTGVARPELACDVCFVGSYWEDKAALIDSYVRPLLYAGLKVKLFGRILMPYPQYLGPIADDTIPDLYASAKTCLNISSGRLSERAYQILGLGGICCSNRWDDGLSDRRPETFVDSTLAGWRPDTCREHVLENDTYFHRVAKMFRDIGMDREAERTLNAAAQ